MIRACKHIHFEFFVEVCYFCSKFIDMQINYSSIITYNLYLYHFTINTYLNVKHKRTDALLLW